MAMLHRWAGRTFFIACFVAFAAVILGSLQPPLLRDYPDWVYQGALLAKTLTGHAAAGYSLKHYPVPNSITTVALALLTIAFGWVWAAKLWLLASLAVCGGTAWFAATTFRSSEWLWWVLPAVFFGQAFWFGTVSFNLGLCLLLLLACLLYREEERLASIAGLLVLCFFMHLIVYAAAGVMVLLYCIQQQRWRFTFIGLATLPLPVWYFAGRLLSHSNEDEFGHSPASHLAVSALVAAVCLVVAWLRPRRALSGMLVPLLLVLATALLSAALVSAAVPEVNLSSRALSALNLLRLKAVAPFQLFGCVNILYQPTVHPLRSATITLLQRPGYLVLMLLCFAVGLGIMAASARRLLDQRGDGNEDRARFLWDFAALFALLYFVCPPNALGVISIDMRLAQIALFPALFLLSRGGSRVLGMAAGPLVLMLAASFYQFVASQREVQIPTTVTGLHRQFGAFGAVDPTSIADEYDRLRTGKLEGFIWTTGIYSQTIPWKRVETVGR